MKPVRIILRRELASYFATPLAYVFIVIFLVFAGLCTFFFGGLFERGQADLRAVVQFPALAVPVPGARSVDAPVGRGAQDRQHRAAAHAADHALAGGARQVPGGVDFHRHRAGADLPDWITVNYLGDPDNGAAFAGYIGAFIMAGAVPRRGLVHVRADQQPGDRLRAGVRWPAHCSRWPAITLVTDWSRALFSGIASWEFWGTAMREGIQSFGALLTDGIAGLSFLTHFENIMKGVLDLRDLLYFALVIVFFLLASTRVSLEVEKVQQG